MRTVNTARRGSTLVALLFLGLLGSSALAMEKGDDGGMKASIRKQVNINTASVSAMAKRMVGIGRTKAKRIVAYRKENGSFQSVDELLEIKGISRKILVANKAVIILE